MSVEEIRSTYRHGYVALFWIEQFPQINPGFNNAPFKFMKHSNAYMLVYIRESDKEKIMCTVDEKDITEHLRVCKVCSTLYVVFLWGPFFGTVWFKTVDFQVRLKKEQEDKEHKKKEKAEAHLYTIIKV